MGTWNPSRDREPDKKEEQAFKQFLISKYERKQWYKSLAEVKMEESAAATAGQENKPEPKLQPPPSTRVSAQVSSVLVLCPYPKSVSVSHSTSISIINL